MTKSCIPFVINDINELFELGDALGISGKKGNTAATNLLAIGAIVFTSLLPSLRLQITVGSLFARPSHYHFLAFPCFRIRIIHVFHHQAQWAS